MVNKDYIYLTNKRVKPRNKLLHILTRRRTIPYKIQFLLFFITTFGMFLGLMWLGLIYGV